jgi:hypothetical protein
MILAEAETKNRASFREKEKVCCPLCGEKMHKADTSKDKNSSFVWFECDQKYCSGGLVQTTNWFQEYRPE